MILSDNRRPFFGIVLRETATSFMRCCDMPSTVIRAFFYDADARLLTVRFTTDRAYRYADVPPEVVAAFRAAPSKGVFFNTHIRDHYDYQPLARGAGAA